MDTTQTVELKPVAAPPTLTTLVVPPGPVLAPDDCPGYGRNLPSDWRCPTCALARACFEALEARATNGNGHEGGNGVEPCAS